MDIQTTDTRIHVRIRYEAPGAATDESRLAFVFLHYWGGSSRTWDGVTAALEGRYRTVASDHRGWGQSGAPEQGYRIADLADDAEQVIGALCLPRYVLVGHSMGGKVAQLLAARRPQGLAGLVLVAPSPPVPMALDPQQRSAMAGAYESRESIEWTLDHVLTARALSPMLREQVIEDSLGGAAAAKSAWPEVAMAEDISGQVSAIDVPVLVIAGEHDQVDTVATLERELLPRLPLARLQVLPGVGHLSPLEAPREVAAAIEQFAGTLAAGEAPGAAGAPESIPALFDQAFNAADVDALLALFCDDATMLHPDAGQRVTGKADLRRQFSQQLLAAPQIHNQVRLSLVSGDVALVLADWTVRVNLPDGRLATRSGTATQVMTRDERGWRLRISNPAGVAQQ